MKTLLSLCLLFATTLCGSEPEEMEPSPFAHSKDYEPLDWPHIEIPIFVLSVGGFWVEQGRWPNSIDEVNEGFKAWAKSADETVRENPESIGKLKLSEHFKISKVIPMWHGVTYRVVYTKKGVSIRGLIVLEEGDSVEEVMKSARYSRDFGGIVFAVPF